MGSTTDPAETARALDECLALQARDAVATALAAGMLAGPEGIALREPLRRMAEDELHDVERLSARIVSLGGKPRVEFEALALPKAWKSGLRALVDFHRKTLETLVEAIPADADDVEGEATEHLLEHVIARKRDDVELLERALG